MRNLILLLLFMCCTLIVNAQKQIPPAKKTNIDKSAITIKSDHRQQVPGAEPSIFDLQYADFSNPIHLHRSSKETKLRFLKDKNNDLPIMISGTLESSNHSADTETKCFEYLHAVKSVMEINSPIDEFVIKKQDTDQDGTKHIRMDQYFNGLKVYGGEVVLHEKSEEIFLFNGRYYPTPQIENLSPAVSLATAENIVKNDQPNWQEVSNDQLSFIEHEQLKPELVIYHNEKKLDQEKLVWYFTAIPNIMEKWEYFIDAQNGDIIQKFSTICQIHGGRCNEEEYSHEKPVSEKETNYSDNILFGPETAQAIDLQGVTRTINVYETGGTFYMIDASRTMFNSGLSNMPNTPSGVIWSIDAFNTSPENSNFNYDHITSGNNTWNNPKAVSAQYSGGVAYEYFKNTFGRESINGQGGNIVSFINVAESNGSAMDNAFWNGAAMFYGNGNQAFNAPLAKALDVAGHEMSHGVIQNEANLTYQNESGALNESFADIFGAMIDRNDWKIGEEVANPSVFPSGTMRDMQDPHNGGNSNDFYWQPKHTDEQYTGNQDNGGVHINSGIPNHAYYLFATAIGKDKAEDIYYEVLKNYLVASSQFIDLRFAVVQATTQEYGAGAPEVIAAQDAFNAVGIGEGGGDDYQDDISANPGADFIMWSDLGLGAINNSETNGTLDGTFSNTDHISRPSITDDGSILLFIDANNDMIEVDIDWSTGQILGEFIIEGSGIWRNVATSKDGSKLAAITTDNNNEIFVFDFNTNSSQWFELYNPTTAEGVSTGDVSFPDVLEWDFSGQFVLYDALNVINGQTSSIEYWDIGFTKVWDLNSNNFAAGTVSKLFTGLPENVSVGNPTFSKNSPYIIAFDFIESTTQGVTYEVLGVNIQTGDQGLISENNTLGYPSYSINDDQIIFSFLNSGTDQIIAIRDLQSNKIAGEGDTFLLIEDAEWATWFATGDRDLNTANEDLEKNLGISVYPNPVQNTLTIEWMDTKIDDAGYQLYDLMGRLVLSGKINEQQSTVNVGSLVAGAYFLRVFDGEKMRVVKLIKNK
jgi:bacillolysin